MPFILLHMCWQPASKPLLLCPSLLDKKSQLFWVQWQIVFKHVSSQAKLKSNKVGCNMTSAVRLDHNEVSSSYYVISELWNCQDFLDAGCQTTLATSAKTSLLSSNDGYLSICAKPKIVQRARLGQEGGTDTWLRALLLNLAWHLWHHKGLICCIVYCAAHSFQRAEQVKELCVLKTNYC